MGFSCSSVQQAVTNLQSLKKFFGIKLLLVLVLLGMGTLYFFDPLISPIYPSCPFYAVTGFHCPGCGTLRSLHRLLHGDLIGAFRMNPLLILLLPLLPAAFIWPSWKYKTWVPWTVLTILVCYGLLRNIPVWPFVLLAPH